MTAQTPLQGQLVRLRARDLGDEVPNFDWFNDPEVIHYLAVRYPSSRRDQAEHIAGSPPASFSTAQFAIEAIGGEYIGSGTLRRATPEDRCAGLGIAIGHPAYRDRGYGTDAMRVLCRFGFEQMGLHRVELTVFPDNPRAIHVYEKVGFRLEGIRRQADYRAGHYRDHLVMGLLEGELR